MPPPVRRISGSLFDAFRGALESAGFSFEERPNQVFLARKSHVVVNLYKSGAVVMGGSDSPGVGAVSKILDSLGAEVIKKEVKEPPPLDVKGARIGTDEVGKGDYFGPLVVAGVLVTDETEKALRELGVRDSKTLSDTTISNMAIRIRQIVGRQSFEEIWISPLKYNLLYQKLRNVNRILGWAHARALENLLSNGVECRQAVADQFGDERYIEDALMRKGRQIKLIQVPKAERDVAVAAASILARDIFLRKLEEMREGYLVDFPKGASQVVEFAKQFVQTHGLGALQNVAKLHFSTTREITSGAIPVIRPGVEEKADLETVSREPTQRELKEASLEIFNLINNFEGELRVFIKQKLTAHYGDDWWTKAIDPNIRKKCEGRQQDEAKKGRRVDLIDCLEFPHYQMTITNHENWDNVFSKVFSDSSKLVARLTIIKDWRDPVYHSRGVIGPKEKAEVVASMNRLRRMMQMQVSLEEFGEAD